MKTTTFTKALLLGVAVCFSAGSMFAQNITGSGTNNYITKFTSTGSTAGNTATPIYEDATNSKIVIGGTTSSSTYGKLTLHGGLHIDDNISAKLEIGYYNTTYQHSYIKIGASSLSLRVSNAADNTDLLVLKNSTGNLGIGTNYSPGTYRLDVDQDINAGGTTTGTSNAYFLGTQKVLWINGTHTNIYAGVDAGKNSSGATGNTFLGGDAGINNYSGTSNVYVGYSAGNCPTCTTQTASNNVFVGYLAGSNNTVNGNTFIGYYAGDLNTTGTGNVFVGNNAGYNNSNGSNNSCFGYYAGQNLASGANDNTLLGYEAGFSCAASATSNTMVGSLAGASNSSGTNNTIAGYNAGYWNQTGTDNAITGYKAGGGGGTVANSFSDNCFFGSQAGYKSTTATDIVMMGYQSGYNNTASWATSIGSGAGYLNTSGSRNTNLGYQAGYSNATSGSNTMIGFSAGYTNTGSYNTCVGRNASSNSTGDGNTAIGYNTGASITTGTYNTCVGYGADAGATGTNAGAFGYLASSTASDKIVIGNSTMTGGTIGGYPTTGWSILSDGRFKTNIKENVPGLAFIMKLRPITYNFQAHALEKFIGRSDSLIQQMNDGLDKAEKKVCTGFIAQEVDSVANKLGYDFDGVYRPQNSKDHYSLGYAKFIVPMVKAMQEQQKMIDTLTTTVAALKSQISTLTGGQRTNGSGNNSNGNTNTEQGNIPSIHELELANTAVLFQNSPNPFGDGTTIKYFVPDNANAQIVFYDEFGTQLKIYKVEEKGMGQLNITATNLSAGVYSYSLIVNGKVIETKKMIKD
ncbi:MAG: tail fiber domain-containing protein [Bacteroidetes bacterium]|nr:tail fiber domain-containing protein [Bacteroidota bacterium]